MKPTSLVLLCAIFLLILAVQESEGYGGTIRQGKRKKLFKKVTISELYIYNDIIQVAVALEIVLGNITHSVSNMKGRSSCVVERQRMEFNCAKVCTVCSCLVSFQ